MKWIIAFPLRVLNALIGWWWYWMERAADGIVHIFVKTEYVRKGSCNQCGKCCRLLALEVPSWIQRREWILRLLNMWHDAVLNFEFQGMYDNWLTYRCRYFVDGVKNSDTHPHCDIYPFRHKLCRFYPRQGLYGHPKLHDLCGFSFIRRDGSPSFDEVLRYHRKS